jgi:hypothetical protein
MSVAIHEFVEVNATVQSAPVTTFGFGSLLGVFTHTVDSPQRVHGPYSSEEAVGEDFDAVDEVMAWARAVFSVEQPIKEVYVGRRDAGDATWDDTLDAIYDEYAGFYFLNVETRTEANVLAVAAWVEAASRPKLYIASSKDAAVIAGTAGNIALDLQAALYTRTALMWNVNGDSDDGDSIAHGYRDGAWASRGGGYNLDVLRPTWDFMQLTGQIADTFTEPEYNDVWDANANIYAEVSGFGATFTSKGTVAQGRPIHTTTSIDWLKRRVQEEVLRMRLNSPQIGIDYDGINKVRNAFSKVLEVGYAAGHLDRLRPTIPVFPDPLSVSSADRAAGLLTIAADVYLKSEARKFVFNFNVSL